MDSRPGRTPLGPLLVAAGCTLIAGLVHAEAVATADSEGFAAIQTLDAVRMGELRGRAGDLTIVSSEQHFNAGVYDTEFNADTINTGSVTVGAGAFAGFSGVGVNVLNSGNSNAINTGVSLTVNLH